MFTEAYFNCKNTGINLSVYQQMNGQRCSKYLQWNTTQCIKKKQRICHCSNMDGLNI